MQLLPNQWHKSFDNLATLDFYHYAQSKGEKSLRKIFDSSQNSWSHICFKRMELQMAKQGKTNLLLEHKLICTWGLQSIVRIQRPLKIAMRNMKVLLHAPSAFVAAITCVTFGFQNLDTVAPHMVANLTSKYCIHKVRWEWLGCMFDTSTRHGM